MAQPPQSTIAEILTLQLAVNEMVAEENRYLRISEIKPFKSISAFGFYPGGPAINLFTITVPEGLCLVLTYIKVFVVRQAFVTDDQLTLYNEELLNSQVFLGTRRSGTNQQLTPDAGISLYTNTPILFPWPSNTVTLMRVTPATALPWPNLTGVYSAYLQWSGYFLPATYFNALEKIKTQFISSN